MIRSAGGGVEPCAPADGLAVAVAGVAVAGVAALVALLLGVPGVAKVTKLESMSGRFPLAL